MSKYPNLYVFKVETSFRYGVDRHVVEQENKAFSIIVYLKLTPPKSYL